jgi:hypothetical protein
LKIAALARIGHSSFTLTVVRGNGLTPASEIVGHENRTQKMESLVAEARVWVVAALVRASFPPSPWLSCFK